MELQGVQHVQTVLFCSRISFIGPTFFHELHAALTLYASIENAPHIFLFNNFNVSAHRNNLSGMEQESANATELLLGMNLKFCLLGLPEK